MMHLLKNIRDFIDLEKMKWSVDSLQANQVLTINRFEEGKDGVTRRVLHVFTSTGTYVGTIIEPETGL